jgi:hypothetical protein
LYIHGYLGVELASRDAPRCFIRYNKLVSDWRVMQRNLNRVLRSHALAERPDRAIEIGRFLTLGLYHHRHSRDDLANDPDIPATVVEMFDRMTDAADTGDEAALRISFDRLRETVGEATTMYRTVIISERARRARLEASASWRWTAPLRWIRHRLG